MRNGGWRNSEEHQDDDSAGGVGGLEKGGNVKYVVAGMVQQRGRSRYNYMVAIPFFISTGGHNDAEASRGILENMGKWVCICSWEK